MFLVPISMNKISDALKSRLTCIIMMVIQQPFRSFFHVVLGDE